MRTGTYCPDDIVVSADGAAVCQGWYSGAGLYLFGGGCHACAGRVRWTAMLWRTMCQRKKTSLALVIEQIEFCNIILLNKAVEVKRRELGHIKSIIRAIQPTAEIIETNYCDVDLEKLLNTGLVDFDKVATSAKWIQEIEDAHHHHDDDDDDDEDDDTR